MMESSSLQSGNVGDRRRGKELTLIIGPKAARVWSFGRTNPINMQESNRLEKPGNAKRARTCLVAGDLAERTVAHLLYLQKGRRPRRRDR